MAGTVSPKLKLAGSFFFGASLIALMYGAGVTSRLWAIPDVSPQKDEVDLSGTWKIAFDDRTEFKDPKYSDQNWCLISVPDSTLTPTPLASDHPSHSCPKENYPTSKMRNATYWYRKTLTIPEGSQWESPSFFLGAIKHEGWVYWDGELIGSGINSPIPLVFLLTPTQAKPGRHTLAIRTKSGDSRYPGLFHAFKRKVAIGEYSRGIDSAIEIQVQNQQRHYPIILNTVAFFLLFFLILRTGRSDGTSLALLGYFGFSAIHSVATTTSTNTLLYQLIKHIALIGMPFSALAYAIEVVTPPPSKKRAYTLMSITLFSILSFLAFALWENAKVFPFEILPKLIAALSLGYFTFVIIPEIIRLILKKETENLPRQLGTLAVLILVQAFNFDAILRPGAFVSPTRIMSALLTLFIILMAIEDHITQQRQLAFFGRFVRKGLKQLLTRYFSRVTGGEKVFQGRKIAVMKIDVEGHTRTTYGMPFGIKRVFQDLWFTVIDQVMADKTFMDKGMGDGSLYYFEGDLKGGTCRGALESALEIRNKALPIFDQELVTRVQELIAKTPELTLPAERFFAGYLTRIGHSFWERKTQVRMVLAFGFADEGLWGLSEQGHYDVEGDLVTLTARLEKQAGSNQIIITRKFYDRLCEEWPEAAHLFKVEWHTAQLRGIGEHEYGLINEANAAVKPQGQAA